jgi:hypothetical protein
MIALFKGKLKAVALIMSFLQLEEAGRILQQYGIKLNACCLIKKDHGIF